MLMMVYDKQGEPFEVRPDVAKKLVIEQGWNMGKAVAATPHAAAISPTAAAAVAASEHPAIAVEHAPEPAHVAPAVAVSSAPVAAPATA
jgi:hypothetical protein